jgi:tagatose-6-phosphate ketose/aldose isomerase
MTASLGYGQAELEARKARWTAREIAQQPALWEEVGAMTLAMREQTEAFLRPLLERAELRIVLAGAGTSAFAGEILAPVLSRALGRHVDAAATTDIVSNPRECFTEDRPTLLVSFARSGDSPESVAATKLAAQCLSECFHLIVTCNREGQLFRGHHDAKGSLVLLMPEAANDQAFAMTSSFTCMLLATLLALGGAAPEGGLVGRLAAAAQTVLSTRGEEARELAEQGFDRVVYLGSGPLKGLARESALKLLELTAGRVIAYFDSPLGFRHGPKSILDDRTLVLVYLSNDPYTRQYDLDIVQELRGALRPGRLIAITAQDDSMPHDGVWHIAGLDDIGDAALALPYVLCAQLIALHFSLALGKAPDNPFPSHEVNRVVQGVTIHELVPRR